MAKIERFEDMLSWQKARELTRSVYQVSKQGDFVKDFELRGQMRGASISIMSNIAEGFERGGDKEFLQFFVNRRGLLRRSTVTTLRGFWTNHISLRPNSNNSMPEPLMSAG